MNYDIAIIGGGIIGSSIAYWLASNEDFNGSIVVIEKDPTYIKSSTALSVGSIRTQFSTPLNIRISKFGIDFIKNIHNHLSLPDEEVVVNFVEGGYLFLTTTLQGKEHLESMNNIQKECGVSDVALLTPDNLRSRFPWLNVDGGNVIGDHEGLDTKPVTLGSFGKRNEGWFDPWLLLQGFRKKALALGVTFINDEVTDIDIHHQRISGLQLFKNGRIQSSQVVNAAGVHSRDIARMAGIDLPVFPRRRFVFAFRSPARIDNCPLVIDSEGFYFRPEGWLFLCGMAPPPEKDPDTFDLTVDYSWFEERLWPRLIRWVPQFDSARLENAWAGHYAYNTFDQNALLGLHADMDNLYFANGFSGHGIQQAPAVGRGMSELITYGEYRTLDLTDFSVNRILENRPVREQMVV